MWAIRIRDSREENHHKPFDLLPSATPEIGVARYCADRQNLNSKYTFETTHTIEYAEGGMPIYSKKAKQGQEFFNNLKRWRGSTSVLEWKWDNGF